ncbi:MAG: HDIG domain-containing protein [Chloroflexi bacterium]|nr:HDIG domain-containing protein [Chloroflexota bacterium]
MLRRRPAPVISRTRAAIFGLLLALAVALLVSPVVPAQDSLHEGEIAPATLIAARDAQFESNALTQQARDNAARQVADVNLPPDPAIRQQQADALDKLFTELRTIRFSGLTAQQQLVELNSFPGAAPLTAAARADLIALDRAQFDAFRDRAARLLTDVMTAGVAKGETAAAVDIQIAKIDNSSLPLADQQALQAMLPALRETVRAFAIPNVAVDVAATQKKKDAARANVTPVIATFTRRQVVASQGQQLDAAAIEALKQTGVIRDGFDFYRIAGGALFALGFGLALSMFLYQLQPFPVSGGRRLAATAIAMVAALTAVRIILPNVAPDREQLYLAFAIPVAAAAMVVASVADLSFAAIVAVAIGIGAAFIAAVWPDLAGSGFVGSLEALELAIAYTAGGLAGALVVHRAERLSRYALAAVAVAAATGIVVTVFWLIGEPRNNNRLAWALSAAGVNGLAAALLALGAFVVLSVVFGVTTRLQLMELAQSGHPLLRRLQDEAPGTYHHSMMVGALAERAADNIGADSLLVRVGAYYHDIGKLAKPPFYIENQLENAASPHDAMAPTESAAAIREHVTAGLELARRHRLPGPVRDFIPEHHGTRLVTFFYRRAMQTTPDLDADAFRYSGPRPQSKETAIVMLADSCEAVVRAHQGQSRPSLEDLVDGVFAERLAEGQLDECDLTMRELQEVAGSFKVTLRAVYHPRIAYPTPVPEELARIAQR